MNGRQQTSRGLRAEALAGTAPQVGAGSKGTRIICARTPRVDPLTGLPDRCGFIAAVQMLQKRGATASVITLDIDQFTELNEEFGLEVGDELLRAMAGRCAHVGQVNKGQCVVGRVGADEFALALVPPPNHSAGGSAAAWVEHILFELQQELALPFAIAGNELTITAEFGQAWLARGNDAAETLQHAVAARRFGGIDSAVHSYEATEGERRLTHSLREALGANRIAIGLQPKIQLSTGRMVGLEALARWSLADGTVVPPSVFIAIAERHNLIAQLGERVLGRVLETIDQWSRAGRPLVPVAVNISALQFHRDDVAERISGALALHGVPARLLELELTESNLLGRADSALRTLHALRALGVCLSIDDFGTGYSSLSYLRRIPVHRLKIHRSFVCGIASDPGAREIVQLLIRLAHSLDLLCVAEGIETREQLQLLREMGCDEGQGFLLAAPMPPPALGKLLEGNPPWTKHFAAQAADARPAPDS